MVLEPASIRSLLIRAWRERWSDIQWGIHIKTVLPRYISGDIYQLSDCILQQALMGSLPNTLILSYLHHSLASQIVSFGGVIESISKYDGFNKPYCIQALLNLMQSMMKNVSCKGKSEDCLMLATSLLAGVKWLIQVMSVAVEKLVELQTAPEHSTNLNLAKSVLHDIVQSPFLVCLFHIGCREDAAVWSDCRKKIGQLQTDITSGAVGIDNKDAILATIGELQEFKPLTMVPVKAKYDSTNMPFCYAVFSLIMLEVMNHTTRDAKVVTKQLLLLQKFKGMTVSELYFEVIRTCFIGMSSPEFKKYQELKWVGFTYIKLPIIIHSIHTSLYGENCGFSSELLTAVQKIATMTPLLDVADHRIKCNCLEYLFKELIPKVAQSTQSNQTPSHDLMTDRDAQNILATRMQESNVLRILKNNESKGSPLSSPDLILRAYPTVIGILKTLTNKNMDSVMSVLSLLISGKSRELLLIAATSSGSLHIYAQKFVRLNEQSKEPVAGETPSAAASRGLVFDISFLLLCHIAQIYGIEVVVSDKCDTFVEQWILDNIPEAGKIKTVLSPSEVAETGIIEDFFRQINSVDSDKYSKTNFADLCRLSALSMRELISAAQHGKVMRQMIFDLLSKFCYHLCSLPICVTAWLCSYMQQVDGEEAILAQEFLNYMQTKMLSHNNVTSSLDTFKDRSNLMSEIIDNMADFMSKPTMYSNMSSPHSASTNIPIPLHDLINKVWLEIKQSNGLLTHKALSMSKDLLRLGGFRWFVNNYVRSALNNVFEKELMRSLDVAYGIFHLDIINCTLNHIIYTLPNYISGPSSVYLLCEPRTSALGRLTAMLLVECWVTIQPATATQKTEALSTTSTPPTSPTSTNRRGEKRSFSQRQMEDLQDRFLATDPVFSVDSLGGGRDVAFFLAAVHHLFTLMTQVSRTATVSPVTHLIVFTLKELASLPHSSTLLSLVHPSLLTNLLPLLSPLVTFDYPQLLSLSAPEANQEGTVPMPLDTLAQTGRKENDVNQASAKLLCVKRNLELIE